MLRITYGLSRKRARMANSRKATLKSIDSALGMLQSILLRLAFLAVSILTLTLVGAALWQAVFRDPVTIEPFQLSNTIVESGWTGEILARELRDSMQSTMDKVPTSHPSTDAALKQDEVDLVLPGGMVSVHALSNLIRSVLQRSSMSLNAEIIELGPDRNSQPCPTGAGSTVAPMFFLRAHLSNAASNFTACGRSIDELVFKCAIWALEQLNPYMVASYYYYTEERSERAREIVDRILANGPLSERPWAMNLSGLLLAEQGDVAKARQKFEEVTRLYPGFAGAFSNWGYVLSQIRDPGALEKYQTAAILAPNDERIFTGWGWALFSLERTTEAIEKYERALALAPESPDIHRLLGDALVKLGCVDWASEEYRIAIRLNPLDPDAFYSWGAALSLRGNHLAALQQYEEAVDIKPDFAEAHLNAGQALLALNRARDAADYFQKAIDSDAKTWQAYNGLGDSFVILKYYRRALIQYERGSAYGGPNAAADRNWAIALAMRGDYEAAFDKLAEAKRLKPDAAELYDVWGYVLNLSGSHEAASSKCDAAVTAREEQPMTRLRTLPRQCNEWYKRSWESQRY